MSNSILIVDSEGTRRVAFADRLRRRYHHALEFDCGTEVQAALRESSPALLLVNADAPPPLGIALCRKLKAEFGEAAILLYSDGKHFVARQEALMAGADDILVLPRDDDALFARLRSMTRLKAMADELEMRQASARELGASLPSSDGVLADVPAKLLLVAPRGSRTDYLSAALTRNLSASCIVSETGFDALRRIDLNAIDAVVVSGADHLNAGNAGFAERENPVELISAIAAAETGRHAAVIYLTDDQSTADNSRRIAMALDAGAADCAYVDEDFWELTIRLRGHIRRKHYADRLRLMVEDGLRDAVRDPLTQLHNRRYLDVHFARRFERARSTSSPLSVLLFDIDRFKTINDTRGHAVGDAALCAFARLLSDEVRIADLVTRYGGEEFLVVMPGAEAAQAAVAAERVRARTATGIGGLGCSFTVSVGVASLRPTDESPEDLIARADAALFDAKSSGRDRVACA